MNRLIFILVVSFSLLLSGCDNESPENYSKNIQQASTEVQYAAQTRSTPPYQDVDDRDIEIIKADLIGAFEGARDALNNAITHGYTYDQMVIAVITSAIVNAVSRSHMAYIEYNNDYHVIWCAPGISNATYLNNFSKDIIRLLVSREVETNEWMNQNLVSTKDPLLKNAITVGQYHNSMMSVLTSLQNFNSFDSYEISLQNFSQPIAQYLQSDEFVNSFIEVSEDPLNFQCYMNIEDDDSNTTANHLMKDFISNLSKVDTYGDYGIIANQFRNAVESSSLTYEEKEALMISAVVGNYSLAFWLQQLHD